MAGKNRINVEETIDLLENGYSLSVRPVNFYQLRIKHFDYDNVFYDWYHTTGSLVRCVDGYNKKMCDIYDSERLAIFIKKDLKNYE